jgi:hypothetical protein
MKKLFLAFFLPFAISTSAHALVQVRVGYGVQTPSDTNYQPNQALSSMHGYNLDALVNIPLVPVGLGLRYENMGFDLSSAGVDASSNMQRTSLLVNYRIIDFFFYLGGIGSIGFANSANITTPSGTPDFKYKSSLTYSVGVEGGISLGLMKLGAELGYLGANFADDAGLGNPDLDLSGVYAKAIVGFGF